MRKNEVIDAIEMKAKAQSLLAKAMKHLSHEEEIAFYNDCVCRGPFGELWKTLGSRKEKAGSRTVAGGKRRG